MVIDAVSQSSGAERTVLVESSGAHVRLAIRDRDAELARVDFPGDALLTVLTDRPEGVQVVVGDGKQVLEVEVRRNEVLLAAGTADAAVGLDDLMDALATALPSD